MIGQHWEIRNQTPDRLGHFLPGNATSGVHVGIIFA